MLSGPVIGMLFVNMNCMQSVNYALPATILSVMRQGVLLIPLLYILQLIAGLEGVIYGQAITDYIAVVLSTVFWRNIGFARVTWIILQLKNEIPAGVRSQSAVRHFFHITGD